MWCLNQSINPSIITETSIDHNIDNKTDIVLDNNYIENIISSNDIIYQSKTKFIIDFNNKYLVASVNSLWINI